MLTPRNWAPFTFVAWKLSSRIGASARHGPHCAAMLGFLDELEDRYDELVVTEHEVWYDTANQQLVHDPPP